MRRRRRRSRRARETRGIARRARYRDRRARVTRRWRFADANGADDEARTDDAAAAGIVDPLDRAPRADPDDACVRIDAGVIANTMACAARRRRARGRPMPLAHELYRSLSNPTTRFTWTRFSLRRRSAPQKGGFPGLQCSRVPTRLVAHEFGAFSFFSKHVVRFRLLQGVRARSLASPRAARGCS